MCFFCEKEIPEDAQRSTSDIKGPMCYIQSGERRSGLFTVLNVPLVGVGAVLLEVGFNTTRKPTEHEVNLMLSCFSGCIKTNFQQNWTDLLTCLPAGDFSDSNSIIPGTEMMQKLDAQ